MLNIKRIKLPFRYSDKVENTTILDIHSLKFEYNEEGKKILCVSKNLNKRCVADSCVVDNEVLDITTNIFNFINKTTDKLSEILLVPFSYMSSRGLSSGAQYDLAVLCEENLKQTIKKYNPDLIVFLGTKLPSGLHKIGSHFEYCGVPAVESLSLFDIASPGDKIDEGRACCAGYLISQIVCFCEDLKFKIPDNIKSVFIDTLDKFDKFFKVLKKSGKVCIDTETRDLSRVSNRLLSLQFYMGGNTAYFLPYEHKDTPFTSDDIKYINKKIRKWFEKGKTKYTIYHNAKFDELQMRAAFKYDWNNHNCYDTMAGEFLLDENRKFLSAFVGHPFGLGQLALEYGSYAYEEGDITKDDRGNMEQFDLHQIMEYGVKDVVIPYYISEFQQQKAKIFRNHKFLTTCLHQIGIMIRVFVEMEYNGTYVDKKHIMEQMSKNSIFNQVMKKVNDGFKTSPNAQEANKMLLKDHNMPTNGGLWGGEPAWIFDIGKEDPKQYLFFDVMGIEPLDFNKKGLGKCDKNFQVYYKDIPEVALLSQYNKVKKLKSSYIDATYKRFNYDTDLKKDGRLRCRYSFTGVVTGRAACSDPNQQQIPSHAKTDDEIAMVNAIRGQFICSPTDDYIQLHADYSAHEVRNWGNVAQDEHVCRPFRHALNLQREIRIADYEGRDTKELVERFETEGDVHKQNYKFFYGKWPETKEQRSSVKSVVFGIIYGKGPASLALDINDSVEKAKSLMKLMFDKFKKGGEWLKLVQDSSSKTCLAYYPNGRIRHLWGYLNSDESLHASMSRKGPNSVIQGFSSDCNFTGGYNLQKTMWDYFGSRGVFLGLKHNNVVHDSIECECPLANVPIALYLIEHSYTTLVHKRYRELFGFNFLVDLVMEFDLGPASNEAYTWNFLYDQYYEFIEKTLKYKEEHWGIKVDKTNYKLMQHNFEVIRKLRYKEIKKAYKNKEETSEIFMLDKVLDKLRPYNIKTHKEVKNWKELVNDKA